MFSLPPEMWSKGCPEYGRLRVSLYSTRDAAENWENAYAKVLQEHQFERGVACPCSFNWRKRGIRIIVHGDDFMSGALRPQLEWQEKVMGKHFESKHTMMGASSDLGESLFMLNMKIVWQEDGIAYIRDKRHCERVVEALNLQHAEAVVTPAVREIAKVLMVRVYENAHGSRCGLLRAKVQKHRCMMHWTQTRQGRTEAQWPG